MNPPDNPAFAYFELVDPATWLGEVNQTARGFPIVSFADGYNDPCSVQQSSWAGCPMPGTSALWIGPEAKRMHLTLPQVVVLIQLLQSWVDTGQLAIPPAFPSPRACRVCGCTDHDCSQCVKKTGDSCLWVAPDLCSACIDPEATTSKDA